MQALIDFIIRNLLALWPITKVDEWKNAMMVRNGRIHRKLAAGRLHWRWIFIEQKFEYPATECVLSLATSSVTTADGHAIAVDANLGYVLLDITKNYRTMWNLESSVKALASGILCSDLATRTWDDLQGTNRKLREAEVLEAINTVTRTFGVDVRRVHLVACVKARQHRHLIDGGLAR